jgi:hypothetical protein
MVHTVTNAIGKANYKGRSYYLLWEGQTSLEHQGHKLAFTDESKSFWAKVGEPVLLHQRQINHLSRDRL